MRLRPDKKYQRQEEALKRNEVWRALSPQQQLESLDERRGNSTKQRTKLLEEVQK